MKNNFREIDEKLMFKDEKKANKAAMTGARKRNATGTPTWRWKSRNADLLLADKER